MGFVFRLEKVLSVRCIQEEAAQQCHARAQEELQGALARLEALRAGLRRSREELDDLKRTDALTPDTLYLHSLHAAGQRRRIEQAAAEAEAASRRAAQAAEALREAHQARQSLEKLRERDQEAWRAAEARKDALRIDELAVSRHRAREEESHGP
ncbi:MAG: flagellar export protein FliJ [Thermodesulfobacteriota bacterium]